MTTHSATSIIPRILEDSPVVVKPNWLPTDTEFPQLNELHEEHIATLADLKDISAQIHTLTAKYELEDDQALEAQRQAYRVGTEPKIPKRTPQQHRDKALQELTERGLVAQDHLREVASEVITTVQANLDHWSGVLRSHEEEARDKVQELRAQMEAAQAEADKAPDVRVWLERTAKGRSNPAQLLHFGWFLHEKPTTDLLAITNEGRNRFNSQASAALRQEMAGGGVDPDVNATPDFSDEVHDYSSPEYQEELERQLQKNVAQRRAGEAGDGTL